VAFLHLKTSGKPLNPPYLFTSKRIFGKEGSLQRSSVIFSNTASVGFFPLMKLIKFFYLTPLQPTIKGEVFDVGHSGRGFN